ncbi:MAG: Rpn family recombination-promoting nuclease/putative transposase [Lachnospiraceae bacterium]|nr:Rpn family recombination-promoting nuclease/putative transposase [Lachnospiraceae bacterium]
MEKQIEIEDFDKQWEELGISNDFLFMKVMQNQELCKELLHRILPDLDIDHIEYPELQKEIKEDMEAKSIRLDVYVKGSKDIIYNIEMQAADTKELPKRSRYYQAMIDLQLLDKGDKSYNELNKTYIIFICLFDLFGQGRHIYTFENLCKEDTSLAMGDEATKIFLNAKGNINDVGNELKVFLDYVSGKKSNDTFVDKLEEAVQKAKKNREWRHDYMTLMMRERINYEKGEKHDEERLFKLIRRLNEDNRLSDIVMAIEDKEYRKKLYKEYDII